MKSMRSLLAILTLVGAFTAGALVPACGGDDKKPTLPSNPSGDAAAGTDITTGDGGSGQVVGVSAGPDVKSDLTGDAKVSYDRAFQAWMAGDLQGAKAGFKEASNKAPSAASPHYSLGCVLERLGDIAGSQSEYRAAISANANYELAVGALAVSM